MTSLTSSPLLARFRLPQGEGRDVSPTKFSPAPRFDLSADRGPVMVTVRYEIAPAAPVFAQCELGCVAECRQSAVCTSAANLEGSIGRQQCAAAADCAASASSSERSPPPARTGRVRSGASLHTSRPRRARSRS